MSSVSVNKIGADGTVCGFRDVRNAMAGAMWVWTTLNEKYAGPQRDIMAAMLKPPCWALAGKGAMSDRDCLVCGFTFDAVWVARENCTALADALDSFYAEHAPAGDVVPTLRGVAEALREVAADEGVRGACFQQTSVTNDPWEMDDGDDCRMFTFGADTTDANGNEPWELFTEFSSDALAAKRADTA